LSEDLTEAIKRQAAAHGGGNVRVLDSPDAADRPVLLVDMEEGRNLFDLVALTEELSKSLGTEVNVLTEGSLSLYLRDAVLAEAVPL
jgi:predicted nucleotidyltransferase